MAVWEGGKGGQQPSRLRNVGAVLGFQGGGIFEKGNHNGGQNPKVVMSFVEGSPNEGCFEWLNRCAGFCGIRNVDLPRNGVAGKGDGELWSEN